MPRSRPLFVLSLAARPVASQLEPWSLLLTCSPLAAIQPTMVSGLDRGQTPDGLSCVFPCLLPACPPHVARSVFGCVCQTLPKLAVIGPHCVRNILGMIVAWTCVYCLLGYTVGDETTWPISLYSFIHLHAKACPDGFALMNLGHQWSLDWRSLLILPTGYIPLRTHLLFFFFFCEEAQREDLFLYFQI